MASFLKNICIEVNKAPLACDDSVSVRFSFLVNCGEEEDSVDVVDWSAAYSASGARAGPSSGSSG